MFGLYDNWGKARSIKSDDNNTNPSLETEDDDHEITKLHFPEDGRLVGSDSIFISSPNVIPHHSSDTAPNPHKRRGIPTPSIYTDERGEIHNIKANDKRINILYTKKGYLRSGDLHPNTQCDFIFSGCVKIWTLQSDGSTKITTYGKHDFIKIPKAVPHVFEFVEDTVLAEWWEPQGFQAWFYKPYRDIVNKKMGVVVSGEGVGRGKRKGLEILMPEGKKGWDTVKLTAAALFVGVIGYAIGRRSR